MRNILDLSRTYSKTYSLPGVCTNCGWSGTIIITKGFDAPRGMFGGRCGRCGCKRVVARDA